MTGQHHSFKRSERLQEQFLEEISKLIQRGLKDPRIGFATVTAVELTDNLKNAKIFVSVYGTAKEKEDTLAGLDSAKGYIRNYLGKNLHLRFIPDLIFKLDETADHVDKISRLLHQIKKDRKEEDEDERSD